MLHAQAIGPVPCSADAPMAPRTPQSTIADAIDRVLQAEHETADAIVAAQDSAAATIAAARETRRTILETARRRSVRMHERAQGLLARRLAELDVDAANGHVRDDGSLAAGVAAAIDSIAEQLTTDAPS